MTFIEKEGEADVSAGLCVILDAQMLQYLNASVTRAILAHLDNIFSAFQAIKKLKEMHETTWTQTLVDLHQKWFDLKFSRYRV